MRRFTAIVFAFSLIACASAGTGAGDAEVRARLETQLQAMVQTVLAGNTDGFLGHFAPEGQLVLSNVTGPDGEPINANLAGHEQIRAFMSQIPAPPELAMNVTSFRQDGTDATQTGQWSIGGNQMGSFTIDWRRSSEELWQVRVFRFEGS
jgi:hypothetical protein